MKSQKIMKDRMINVIIIFLFHSSTLSFDLRTKYFRSDNEANGTRFYALDFLGLIEKHGRKVEWHNVTTEDGYILSLFRIPPNPSHLNETVKSRAFYLQPGLGATADIYILFGPGRSLAYSLSDAGYDVWIGNVRGTHYSRRHKKYSTDDSVFWDFSMDDYALRDLPAMFDYIIATTGQPQLSYIGHSLGSTLILILLADKPEYNSKLTVVIHFAPVSYWKTWNLTRLLLAIVASLVKILLPRASEFPIQSIIPAAIIHYFCLINPITMRICAIPFEILLGEDREQFDVNEEAVYLFCHYPAGTSAKVIQHYGQHVLLGNFGHYKQWAIGSNRGAFDETDAAEYNLSNVRAPTIIFEAPNDPIATLENAENLIKKLPLDLELRYEIISYKKFNHRDFSSARNVEEILYKPMITILEEPRGFGKRVED
ncbi:lipase 3-like isoform X1 [Diachasmimorpha longicaudata]|uniref:lipase 3-like isoform X1 n=1 Tax=Diachasmimorpha longicaudata TaxID=58733 RepID=UPI0030B919DA